MCGIVGVASRGASNYRKTEIEKVRKTFTEMLIRAQERGASATGVFLTTKDAEGLPKIYTLRSPLPAGEFVKTKDYKEFSKLIDDRFYCVVGHTRAPSGSRASAKDNVNNHPFYHKPILGVHNGRIMNDEKIWKDLKGKVERRGECDSEAFFALVSHYIENEGLRTEDAINEAVKKAKGWIAFAMVNAKEPEKIHLMRDLGSPLEVFWWTWPEVVLFGSETKYVYDAVEAANSHSAPKRLSIGQNKLVTLDTTYKGSDSSKVFASYKTLEIDEEEKKRLIEENREEYEATQGK